jgi:hypothetical protein
MAEVTLKIANCEFFTEWNDWVKRSENSTLYHHIQWLEAMAIHTSTKLIPLIIYKGKAIAGLFPVFLKKTLLINFIYSPPPGCAVPYLGPIFLSLKLKQKDMEAFHHGVMHAFNLFCNQNKADYIKINTVQGFSDARAFLWNGFKAKPYYEYRIKINCEENEILSAFQSDTRNKIRRAQQYEDLKITCADKKAHNEIFHLTNARYKEQGITWLVTEPYIDALLQSEIGVNFQSWVAQYEHKTITGLIGFQYNGIFHEWIGGVNPAKQISGVNELLHWKIIQNAKRSDCRWHDLGGANTPHLSRSKLKFSPQVFMYFEFKKKNLKSRIIDLLMQFRYFKHLYIRLRK